MSSDGSTQGSFCSCGAWRGALGLEPTIDLYVAHMVEIFREVRRVLKDDGTLWLNLGDSYATGAGKACSPGGGDQGEEFRGAARVPQRARPEPETSQSWCTGSGHKEPEREHSDVPAQPDAATWPQAERPVHDPGACGSGAAGGWLVLRSEIVWHKTNPMPESVTDRPTKAHEMMYLLSKSGRYYYDADAIKEPCKLGHATRYDAGAETTTNGRTAVQLPDDRYQRPTSGEKRKHATSWGTNVTPVRERGLKPSRRNAAPVGSTGDGRNKRTVWTLPTETVQRRPLRHLPAKAD